jgi:hypothetical protein
MTAEAAAASSRSSTSLQEEIGIAGHEFETSVIARISSATPSPSQTAGATPSFDSSAQTSPELLAETLGDVASSRPSSLT